MGLFKLFGKKKEQNKESNSRQEAPEQTQTAPNNGSVDSSNSFQSETKTTQEPGNESFNNNGQAKTYAETTEQAPGNNERNMTSLDDAPNKYNESAQEKEQLPKENTATEKPPEMHGKQEANTQTPSGQVKKEENILNEQELPPPKDPGLNKEQWQQNVDESEQSNESSDIETETQLQNFSDSSSEKKKLQQQTIVEDESSQEKQAKSQIEQDPDLKEILEEELPPPPQIDLAATQQVMREQKEALKGLSYPEKIELLKKKGNKEKSEEESLAGLYKRAFPKSLYPQKNALEEPFGPKEQETSEEENTQNEEVQAEPSTTEPEISELFITAKNFRELSEFIDSISSEVRVAQDSVTRTRELEKETDILLNSWKQGLDNSNKLIENIDSIVFK